MKRNGNETKHIILHNGKPLKKGYHNSEIEVWSAGNPVTYYVDSGVLYTEEVETGTSCLHPSSFTPTKSGYTFAGWREDMEANEAVLSSKMMEDKPITLYAVFTQDIILKTVANGIATDNTKKRYYNNENIANPTFTISDPQNSEATFNGWSNAENSETIENSSINNLELSASETRYAVFTYNDASVNMDEFGYDGATYGFNEVTIESVDFSKYYALSFDFSAYLKQNWTGYTARIEVSCGGGSVILIENGIGVGGDMTGKTNESGSKVITFVSTTGTGQCITSVGDGHMNSPHVGFTNAILHGRTVVG